LFGRLVSLSADVVSMACSEKVRVPFRDHRLVEQVYRMQSDVKYTVWIKRGGRPRAQLERPAARSGGRLRRRYDLVA
jgi:hypothetical protein